MSEYIANNLTDEQREQLTRVQRQTQTFVKRHERELKIAGGVVVGLVVLRTLGARRAKAAAKAVTTVTFEDGVTPGGTPIGEFMTSVYEGLLEDHSFFMVTPETLKDLVGENKLVAFPEIHGKELFLGTEAGMTTAVNGFATTATTA